MTPWDFFVVFLPNLIISFTLSSRSLTLYTKPHPSANICKVLFIRVACDTNLFHPLCPMIEPTLPTPAQLSKQKYLICNLETIHFWPKALLFVHGRRSLNRIRRHLDGQCSDHCNCLTDATGQILVTALATEADVILLTITYTGWALEYISLSHNRNFLFPYDRFYN